MKRRMPAHIVLPNGMWRFVKRGSSSRKARRSVRKVARRRGYARRFGRYYGRARRSYRRSGGLMGMLKPVLFGGVATYASDKFAPQVIPMQGLAAGAAGGYVARKGINGAILGLAGGWLVEKFVSGGSSAPADTNTGAF